MFVDIGLRIQSVREKNQSTHFDHLCIHFPYSQISEFHRGKAKHSAVILHRGPSDHHIGGHVRHLLAQVGHDAALSDVWS